MQEAETATERTMQLIARKREAIARHLAEIDTLQAEIDELLNPTFTEGHRVILTSVDGLGATFTEQDTTIVWTVERTHGLKVDLSARNTTVRTGYRETRYAMNVPMSNLKPAL